MDELAAYLALPQVKNEGESTPLNWWEKNAHLFPNLAVMARQYLGCPATSATVERLFSAVGLAFSDGSLTANKTRWRGCRAGDAPPRVANQRTESVMRFARTTVCSGQMLTGQAFISNRRQKTCL